MIYTNVPASQFHSFPRADAVPEVTAPPEGLSKSILEAD